MSQIGNQTPTKRKVAAAGSIQHISPRKMSKKGNAYYTFQLQTDAGKFIKGACFSPQKEKELHKFSESKSRSRLSGIVRDEKSGEILVNDATQVTSALFSEVAFPYKEMESLVPMPKKCVQSDVSASKEQVGTTELICVTGDLFYF